MTTREEKTAGGRDDTMGCAGHAAAGSDCAAGGRTAGGVTAGGRTAGGVTAAGRTAGGVTAGGRGRHARRAAFVAGTCWALASAAGACTESDFLEGTGGAGGDTTSTTTTTNTNSGGGGGGGGGDGGGGAAPVPCSVPSDCPGTDGDCAYRSCVADTCGITLAPLNAQCDEAGGEICDGAGQCLKALGTACGGGAECVGSQCADGVCCDTACTGNCMACDIAGAEGTCSDAAPGTDPGGDCAGGSCDGSGLCSDGAHVWDQTFGSANWETPFGVAVDTTGNAIVVGAFSGSIDFGCGSMSTLGSNDAFVVKLAPAGSCVWQKRFGGLGNDVAYGVAVQTGGNVVVTGQFASTVDFGGGNRTAAGYTDIFVVRLDAAGNHLWSVRFGATDSATNKDVGLGVATNTANDVFVTGLYGANFVMGGTSLTNAGGNDAFVAKLNSQGTAQWAVGISSAANDTIAAPATDANDGVYVAATRDDGTCCALCGPDPGLNLHVMKLAATGNVVWDEAPACSYPNDQTVSGLSVSSTGTVAVSGLFEGAVGFGGAVLTSAGLHDTYLVELDGAAGSHVSSRRFGDSTDQDGRMFLAHDANGNLLVAGALAGSIDLGGGPLTSTGGLDAYVAKFHESGALLWSKRYGDGAEQLALGVDADGAGNVYAVGAFQGTVDFGSGVVNSAGSNDAFIVKLGP